MPAACLLIVMKMRPYFWLIVPRAVLRCSQDTYQNTPIITCSSTAINAYKKYSISIEM